MSYPTPHPARNHRNHRAPCPAGGVLKKGDTMLTDDDRAELVEEIQRATAGMNDAQRAHVLECWEFMAEEFRRVLRASQPAQPQRQLPQWGA